jgi:hypothetical protein
VVLPTILSPLFFPKSATDAFLAWYYLEAQPSANKEGTVQTTKVELHQFRWDSDNKLTHIPTGATFSWKYPHSDLSDVIIHWKNAADLLPTGERFDPCEIEAVARRIMRTYGPA